jgi:hypothetical protein
VRRRADYANKIKRLEMIPRSPLAFRGHAL